MATISYDSCGSEVAEFYRGRDVLLTGASGFLGKVVLEKLLRSCPVGNIYVAVRPKRNVDYQERLLKMLSCELFETLRTSHPEVLSKVIPIRADLCSPGLGLSERDRRVLQNNVSVVLHCAASVRMDESLKEAVATNLHGTYELLKLSRKIEKLEVFVHVSTLYANCETNHIKEIIYETNIDPEFMLAMTRHMKEDFLQDLAPRLLCKHPNTYAYTKALSEKLVSNSSKELPVAIVRPSIVSASNAEPVPGWVQGAHGGTGVLAAIGKGFIHSLHSGNDVLLDLVPVDFVANAIIAVSWNTARQRNGALVVYNCSSGHVSPVTMKQLVRTTDKYSWEFPARISGWYPGRTLLIGNKWLHKTFALLVEVVPALVVDTTLMILGRKERLFPVVKRIHDIAAQLAYFTTHSWCFDAQNLDQLRSSMNEVDRALFNFNFSEIQWHLYMRSYIQGSIKYLLKEYPNKEVESSKRHKHWLFYPLITVKNRLLYMGYRCMKPLLTRLVGNKSMIGRK